MNRVGFAGRIEVRCEDQLRVSGDRSANCSMTGPLVAVHRYQSFRAGASVTMLADALAEPR